MAALATLTVSLPVSDTFSWDLLNFENGFPDIDLVWQPQKLVSMGVDGTRVRLNRKDYPEFGVRMCRGFTNFDGAVTEARALRTMNGSVGTLVFTSAGVTYTPSTTFYIVIQSSTPRPGRFIGGEVEPAGAYLEAFLRLQATGVAP